MNKKLHAPTAITTFHLRELRGTAASVGVAGLSSVPGPSVDVEVVAVVVEAEVVLLVVVVVVSLASVNDALRYHGASVLGNAPCERLSS